MANEDTVQRILAQHEDALSRLRNVVALGIVPATDGSDDGEMAVAVYVTSKVPEAELDAADLIPRQLESIEAGAPVQVPTRVIEIGKIVL